MANQFDWQTEDEAWETTSLDSSALARPARRWQLAPWLATLLLLATSGWLVLQRAQAHVRESTAAARAEVEASYRLVRAAAASRDVELMRLYLSGRDPTWTDVQLQLLERGRLFNERDMGLNPQGEHEIVDVAVAPDMLSAEVSIERLYTARLPAGETTAVRLRQTLVFRRGSDRWLWSPPDAAYWGGETYEGGSRYFTLACPTRDEEFCQFLAGELDVLLAEMCAGRQAARCPDGKLIIRLSTEPASRIRMRWNQLYRRGIYLQLPTISLIGTPVDAAGREILYHQYAAFIVTRLLTGIAEYDCCYQGLFFQAAVDKQLSQMGLQAWPLLPADYERVLTTRRHLHDFHTEWRWAGPAQRPIDNDTQRQVYALIDFLTENTAYTPLALQRQFGTTQNYWTWLNQFTGTDSGISQPVEDSWRAFLAARSRTTSLASTP